MPPRDSDLSIHQKLALALSLLLLIAIGATCFIWFYEAKTQGLVGESTPYGPRGTSSGDQSGRFHEENSRRVNTRPTTRELAPIEDEGRLDVSAKIQGRVLDSEGRPAHNATVFIFDSDLVDNNSIKLTGRDCFASTESLEDGRFTVNINEQDFASRSWDLLCKFPGHTQAVVTSLRPAGLSVIDAGDIELKLEAQLSVVVSRPSGPIEGVDVEVTQSVHAFGDQSSRSLRWIAKTDARGVVTSIS